jgi:hypothetical protein
MMDRGCKTFWSAVVWDHGADRYDAADAAGDAVSFDAFVWVARAGHFSTEC